MKKSAYLFCFTGIDGSGKTTQAMILVDWLKTRGIKVEYVWSRGEVLAVRNSLLILGRKMLGTSSKEIARDKGSYEQYQGRKNRLMRNPLLRTIWTSMTFAEHIHQINRDIRRKMRQGCSVVCDRYLWDSSIDMAILNRKDPRWLAGAINRSMWRWIPSPTLTFFIDIPPEEAFRRKDDIPSLDYVTERAGFYRSLESLAPLTVIDGCQEVAAVQKQVTSMVEKVLKG